jgi:S1-C subfamily serine protease
VTVQFEDNISRRAAVIGVDPNNDLALLRVNMSGVPSVQPLELGDSESVQVGDPTLAIGNPFGLDRTLTSGIVSALQRQIQAPNGFAIDNVIQTDAPINPGNSGGPLLDADGRVIGINSQIETAADDGEGSVGIGFAIPIDTAKAFLPRPEQRADLLAAAARLRTERALALKRRRRSVKP